MNRVKLGVEGFFVDVVAGLHNLAATHGTISTAPGRDDSAAPELIRNIGELTQITESIRDFRDAISQATENE